MNPSRFGTYLVTIAVLFAEFSFGQDRIIYEEGNNTNSTDARPRVHHNSYYIGRIPENMLMEISRVQNVTEFLRRFVHEEELSFESPTMDNGPLSSRRNPLAGVQVVAKPATCQPELHVVELNKGNGLQFLWPPCVRVRRCGGCCISKALTCVPVAVSFLNVTVLQMFYNPLIPGTFTNEGTHIIPLAQHDRCMCNCKIKAYDCSPLQEYRPNECKCVCSNQELASQCTDLMKIWDNDDCMCKCRRIADCSTGSIFNFSKCRCESTRRSRAGNLDHLNTTSTTTTTTIVEDP